MNIIIHLLHFHYYIFISYNSFNLFILFIYCYKVSPKLRLIRGKPLYHLDIFREIYEKDITTRA